MSNNNENLETDTPFELIYQISEFAKLLSKKFDMEKVKLLYNDELDYSIISNEKFKVKMDNFYIKMIIAKYNLLNQKDDTKDDYYRYAHLQLEGLMNFYCETKYMTVEEFNKRHIKYWLDNSIFNTNQQLEASDMLKLVDDLFLLLQNKENQQNLSVKYNSQLEKFKTKKGDVINISKIASVLKFKFEYSSIELIPILYKFNIFHGDYILKQGWDEYVKFRIELNDYRNKQLSHAQQNNYSVAKFDFIKDGTLINKTFDMLIDTVKFIKSEIPTY